MQVNKRVISPLFTALCTLSKSKIQAEWTPNIWGQPLRVEWVQIPTQLERAVIKVSISTGGRKWPYRNAWMKQSMKKLTLQARYLCKCWMASASSLIRPVVKLSRKTIRSHWLKQSFTTTKGLTSSFRIRPQWYYIQTETASRCFRVTGRRSDNSCDMQQTPRLKRLQQVLWVSWSLPFSSLIHMAPSQSLPEMSNLNPICNSKNYTSTRMHPGPVLKTWTISSRTAVMETYTSARLTKRTWRQLLCLAVAFKSCVPSCAYYPTRSHSGSS